MLKKFLKEIHTEKMRLMLEKLVTRFTMALKKMSLPIIRRKNKEEDKAIVSSLPSVSY